jgi:hypothetical protein
VGARKIIGTVKKESVVPIRILPAPRSLSNNAQTASNMPIVT